MFKIIATTLILAISTFGIISTNAQSTQPKPNNDEKRSQKCETKVKLNIAKYTEFLNSRKARVSSDMNFSGSVIVLEEAVINTLKGKTDTSKLEEIKNQTKSSGNAEIFEMNKKLDLMNKIDCKTPESRKASNSLIKEQHKVIVKARSELRNSRQLFNTTAQNLLKTIA